MPSSNSLPKRADGNDNYSVCERSCAPRVRFVDEDAGLESRSVHALNAEDSSYGPAISQRDMTLPRAGQMEEFMVKEVPKAVSIVWEIPKGNDLNTAMFKDFARLPFSLGTSGLCGCTSLWIISRKGVYATHYWESISFSPDDIWREPPEETDQSVFQRTVIHPLEHGEETEKTKRLIQAKLDAGKIEDDTIRAYLVHPEGSCAEDDEEAIDGYRSQWDQIKEKVGDIIPSLNPDTHGNRWEEIIYVRKDREDEDLFTTAAGRVLFKFDPKHEGRKKAVLWVEDREEPYHDDEW